MFRRSWLLCGATLLGLTFQASSVRAFELIQNGGFETGSFLGWSAQTEAGSMGVLQIVPNGSSAPLSGYPLAKNPNGGNFVAITDLQGPSAFSLSQLFINPVKENITVSFDLFANNYYGQDFVGPLDYNQSDPVIFARADILRGSADPFSTSPSDIIATLYGPGSDGNGKNPYKRYSQVLNLDFGFYRIRFGTADNGYFFNLGVDNVSVQTVPIVNPPPPPSVPLPPSAPMFGAALLGLAATSYAAKRRRAAAV